MADTQALTRSLLDLAGALDGRPPDDQRRQEIETWVDDNELPEGDAVPDWLLDMLTLVSKRQTTPDWVPFTLRGLDDSDALDLARAIHEVLPVEVENNEESWLLTFQKLGVEAAISLEGPSYKVSRLGETWH